MFTKHLFLISLINISLANISIFPDGAGEGAIGGLPEILPDTFSNAFDFNDTRVPFVPTPELIQNEGYPSESHYVTTIDGYILNIHRLPCGRTGKRTGRVVYLQHGLFASSVDWVLFGSEKGLGYILADAGYDVWFGNVRGNVYSRNHTWLSPNDAEFWDFSWHEIGCKDMPAIIDYILEYTGQSSLYNIGHSQGTTTFYVMASERPEYNERIKVHISLSPIAFMNHMFSPILRFLALGAKPLENILQLFGQHEFLSRESLFNTMCSIGIGKVLCKNAVFAVYGFSPSQMNASSMAVLSTYYPAGASTKQLVHYGQEVMSGRFRKYDYEYENLIKYGTKDPPDYDISKISVPIHLIYSSNDWLAAVEDVERLFEGLPNGKEMYKIPIPTWNHIDFLFGNDAPKVVYGKVLDILSKYLY